MSRQDISLSLLFEGERFDRIYYGLSSEESVSTVTFLRTRSWAARGTRILQALF